MARTRLILLGTGGGPRPKTNRMSSAQVIIADERLYVVDCGNGVAPAHQRPRADPGRRRAAGVRTLVLSHLVPADDPMITEQMWIDAARAHFDGEVIVGRDLMEI